MFNLLNNVLPTEEKHVRLAVRPLLRFYRIGKHLSTIDTRPQNIQRAIFTKREMGQKFIEAAVQKGTRRKQYEILPRSSEQNACFESFFSPCC